MNDKTMEEKGYAKSGRSNALRLAVIIVVGLLGFLVYYLYVMALPIWMEGVDFALLPIVSLAIGVFIGRKVERSGWVVAAIPPMLLLLPSLIAHGFPPSPQLGMFRLPVSVLVSMFGGYLGSHLQRTA